MASVTNTEGQHGTRIPEPELAYDETNMWAAAIVPTRIQSELRLLRQEFARHAEATRKHETLLQQTTDRMVHLLTENPSDRIRDPQVRRGRRVADVEEALPIEAGVMVPDRSLENISSSSTSEPEVVDNLIPQRKTDWYHRLGLSPEHVPTESQDRTALKLHIARGTLTSIKLGSGPERFLPILLTIIRVDSLQRQGPSVILTTSSGCEEWMGAIEHYLSLGTKAAKCVCLQSRATRVPQDKGHPPSIIVASFDFLREEDSNAEAYPPPNLVFMKGSHSSAAENSQGFELVVLDLVVENFNKGNLPGDMRDSWTVIKLEPETIDW